MKTHILVVGKHNEELISLHQGLSAYKTYSVVVATNSSAAIHRIKNSTVDLVIFNLDTFSRDKIRLVSDLRDIGYNFPVLVLADEVSAEAFKLASKFPRMLVLEKPFEWRTANGVIRKLCQGHEVRQQFSRRFRTDQIADMESIRSGQQVAGRLKNLSATGAFIEFMEGSLQIGDILRMNVELGELSKSHSVTAQVVWASRRNPMTGISGVGLRFIGAGDVYQLLLQES